MSFLAFADDRPIFITTSLCHQIYDDREFVNDYLKTHTNVSYKLKAANTEYTVVIVISLQCGIDLCLKE